MQTQIFIHHCSLWNHIFLLVSELVILVPPKIKHESLLLFLLIFTASYINWSVLRLTTASCRHQLIWWAVNPWLKSWNTRCKESKPISFIKIPTFHVNSITSFQFLSNFSFSNEKQCQPITAANIPLEYFDVCSVVIPTTVNQLDWRSPNCTYIYNNEQNKILMKFNCFR